MALETVTKEKYTAISTVIDVHIAFFSLSLPFSMYFTSTIIVKYDKICPNKLRIVLSSICCLLPVFDSCDCETMDSSLCVNSHFPFSIKCSRFIYDNILHALCARRLFYRDEIPETCDKTCSSSLIYREMMHGC